MSAVIEIESLDLEGMTEDQGRRAARTFEATLSDLLTRDGLPEGVTRADIDHVDLGDLPRSTQTPEGVGRELARALFAELWR